MDGSDPNSKRPGTPPSANNDAVDDLFGSVQHTKHKPTHGAEHPKHPTDSTPLTSLSSSSKSLRRAGMGRRLALLAAVAAGFVALAVWVVERYSSTHSSSETAQNADPAPGGESAHPAERKFENPFTTIKPGSMPVNTAGSTSPSAQPPQPSNLNLSHRKGDSRPFSGAGPLPPPPGSDHGATQDHGGDNSNDARNSGDGSGDGSPNLGDPGDAGGPGPNENGEPIPPGEG